MRMLRFLPLLLLLGCVSAPREDVILLTGFTPFGGRTANVSWDAIAPLEGTHVRGAVVRCVLLKTEWGEVEAPLKAALDRWHPAVVLCLGEGRPGKYSVETVARNQVAPYPDNRKALPGRTVVLAGAPESYPTTLPVDAVVEALGRQGSFPVERSADTGKYLCEECFFTLQHLAARGEDGGMAGPHGFLHVPPYPKERVGDPIHAANVREGVVAVLEAIRGKPASGNREKLEGEFP